MEKRIRMSAILKKGGEKRIIVESLPTGNPRVKLGLFKGGEVDEFFTQALSLLHFLGWRTVQTVGDGSSGRCSSELLLRE